jgi:NTP pyrophosphatase (non-canonical NTP hydrolase)
MSEMNEYQQKALATAAVRQKNRAGKAWAALEFASEALELNALIVSGVTKAQFRPKGKAHKEFVQRLRDELGDMLWTISVLAGVHDINLSDLAAENLAKVGVKHGDLGSPALQVVEHAPAVAGPAAKPEDPFPWLKGNKKAITSCPQCGTPTVFKEGCVSCPAPDCGFSAC